MDVTVEMPSSWCRAPLRHSTLIADPRASEQDYRYSEPPRGGWDPIAAAVEHVLDEVDIRLADPLVEVLTVTIRVNLTSEAQLIVANWFTRLEALQWEPGDTELLNGRHRLWGMRSIGRTTAPIMNIPLSDAVYYWRPDPLGWPPLNRKAIQDQRTALAWWQNHPDAQQWREQSPNHTERWQQVIDAWERRLGT